MGMIHEIVTNGLTIAQRPTERATAPRSFEPQWRRILPAVRIDRLRAGIDGAPALFDELCARLAAREMTRNKGVLLYSNTGCGKTRRLEFLRTVLQCSFLTARRVFDGAPEETEYDDLCLDDLGTEPVFKNEFGTVIHVVADFLEMRYDLWRRRGVRTLIATNLTREMIARRYGDRVSSRLEEMCVFINMTGPDRRFGLVHGEGSGGSDEEK